MQLWIMLCKFTLMTLQTLCLNRMLPTLGLVYFGAYM